MHRAIQTQCRYLHTPAPTNPQPQLHPQLQTCKTLPQLKPLLSQFLVNGLLHQSTLLFQLITFLSQSQPQNPSFLIYASLLVQTQHHHYPNSSTYLHNTLIKAYSSSSFPEQGISTYKKMIHDNIKPDNFTYPSVLKCVGLVLTGKQMHGQIVRNGFVNNVFVTNTLMSMYCGVKEMREARRVFEECGVKDIVTWNSLIDGYVKVGCLDLARELFEEMPEKDEVSWTGMISGYAKNGDMDVAQGLFDRMPICRNVVTYNSMISGFGKCGFVSLARKLFDEMAERNIVTWNSMISAYAQSGEIEVARALFDEMPRRDVFTWSCMISGYAQGKRGEDVLKLFNCMIDENVVKPNEVTLVSVLSVCGQLAMVEQGKWIHEYVKRNGMRLSDTLGAALVDMYAKCGCVEMAYEVFSKVDQREVSSWNALITGVAVNGIAHEALEAFTEMQRSGIKPNSITFLGVLMASCHGGLVEEGRRHFNQMVNEFGVQPEMKHYGCMIDLLGRAGLLEEAEDIIKSMPMKPDVMVLGAVLAACRIHGNIEIAARLRKDFLELKSHEAGCHVLYSNIYAGADRWIDASDMRDTLTINQIKKAAGLSSVEALDIR